MKIKALRTLEKNIKSTISRFFIKDKNFTIISNNCWGTFIYKKFGLNYKSPFINLLIFAPDYIELLENFSKDVLYEISFIQHASSKHKDEMIYLGIYEDNYPIGILNGKYELHFLHYNSQEDAKDKWLRRVDRMNFDKLIFKFSDGDKCSDDLIRRFDQLDFANKVCFSSRAFNDLSSVVHLKRYEGDARVHDEWKVSKNEFNSITYINSLR